MTAFISASASGHGVQVYQDHSDKSQFYYVPLRVDTELGGALTSFKVDYWGIGRSYLAAESGSGKIRSMFGAILSGTASFDVSDQQRKKITDLVKKQFKVSNPRLSPLRLKSAKVSPVWAETTLTLGAKSDVIFPTDFQFGSQFNFLFGTGNSLFANFVGSGNAGSGKIQNPSFGLNVVAMAEFRGEPWKVTVEADLKSVWKEIRTKVSASGRFGWFNLGSADFNNIVTELTRTAVIKTVFEQGSLDTASFGNQIFEMGRRIAEKINGIGGGDFFKFEPNPEPGAGAFNALGLLSGWSVSINLSKQEQSFTQTFSYRETLEFQGNFEAAIPAGMTLAVSCAGESKRLFNELGDAEPCITSSKVNNLQQRLEAEKRVKEKKKKEVYDALLAGKIDLATFERLNKFIDEETFTEGADVQQFQLYPEVISHPDLVRKIFGDTQVVRLGIDEDDYAAVVAANS